MAKKPGVDTAWFEKKIAESPYGSMRQLANRIRLDNGKVMGFPALWKTLNNRRVLQLHEARQLADLLGVGMGEIIRRAGIPFGERDNV